MKKRINLIIVNVCLLILDLILFILSLTTNNSQYFYALGVTSGITFVLWLLSILYLILWKKNQMKTHFDERQLKNRGDCHSISFFVLIGSLFIDGLIRLWFGIEWSNYFIGTFTWIMVSIGVFAILAIWKDAYVSAERDRIKLGIFLLIIGILDLVIGLTRAILDGILINKQIDYPFINILGGIIVLIIAINIFIKVNLDGKETFKDEELETEVC